LCFDTCIVLVFTDLKEVVYHFMVVVKRNKGEPSDIVWRKFGKINYEENLVDELRARKYYKKPSLVRKEEEKMRGKKRRGTRMRKPLLRSGRTRTSRP